MAPESSTSEPGRPESSTISVPAESEQVTIVRQFVRLACHRYGCDAVTDNILLVTDEMMAAALVHAAAAPRSAADSTVEVGIIPTQRGVRIEVHDHVHDEPGGPRLEVYGEVDLATAGRIRRQVLARLEQLAPGSVATLDLRPTGYLASAGVGLVLEAVARARQAGVELRVLTRPGTPPARILALAGVDEEVAGTAGMPQ